MINSVLVAPQQRMLAPVARWLAPHVSANQVTIAGFLVGLCCAMAIAAGWFQLGLMLLLVNRLADGLDGAVARINGPTDRGAFLDITLDFIFYALFPLSFALNDPAVALPAAILIASFVGTGSSFLAYAAISARHGRQNAPAYPGKGIVYLGGLTEGAETIAVFAAMCLWPGAFAWLAYGFAAACLLTLIGRLVAGWRAFGP